MTSLKLKKLFIIGASTGGPGLIEKILTSLENFNEMTIVIAQHMEAHHLSSFAKRLGRINNLPVVLVEEKIEITSGKVYVLQDTSEFVLLGGNIFLQQNKMTKSYYHPQIDELFFSASRLQNIKIVTYLLSGIGSDGAKGMLALKEVGQKTIAQDKETSIVYGMPKSAYEMGACNRVMSIDDIIDDIKREMV
ncbi:chemotaxis protein CheB [Sulfurimonas sp.]